MLTRFTVRPDGRTPFQYLLGTPYVSPLRMFGESVVALIPDHEVRAAKLTNRWISGCWWGRDASSDEHLVGTKFVIKCRTVRRKPPGEQWSRRETVEARGTKWNFYIGVDAGIPFTPMESRRDEEMPSVSAQRETPMLVPPVPPPAHPPQLGSDVPEVRGQGVHAKALRIRSFWSEIGRTLGCPACETPGPGKSHTRECKAHQDAWEESRHTARAEEAKRGFDEDQIHDHGTRVRVQQIRSRRDRKRTLVQTLRTRQVKWMWTAFKGHLQIHIRWNLPVTRTCRRKRESQETCFTSVVRVN